MLGVPFPAHRVPNGRGDEPVACKPSETVDAELVVELVCAVEPRRPPGVFIFGHFFPVVQGVPPELACGAESIGRDAAHECRGAGFRVEFEE